MGRAKLSLSAPPARVKVSTPLLSSFSPPHVKILQDPVDVGVGNDYTEETRRRVSKPINKWMVPKKKKERKTC